MFLTNWLRQLKLPCHSTTSISQQELDQLDQSAQLLRSTAEEVSQAAITTAKVITDKFHDIESRAINQRTKACFQALNSASDIIVILDAEENIFFCNDMFVSSFGLTDYKTCVGQKLESITGNFPENMWRTARSNKMWKGMFQKYSVITTPIMNGQPQPIYYNVIFKN